MSNVCRVARVWSKVHQAIGEILIKKYMERKESLLSIGDDGIKIDLHKGNSMRINSDRAIISNVTQEVEGGELEYRARNELIQIGNTMEANEGGRILNQVDKSKLNQIDNQMQAIRGGIIENKVMDQEEAGLGISFVNIQGDGNILKSNSFQYGETNNRLDGSKSVWKRWIIFAAILAGIILLYWRLGFPISFNFSTLHLF